MASRKFLVLLAVAAFAWAGPFTPGMSGQQAEPGVQLAAHHLVEFSGPVRSFEANVRAAAGTIEYLHAGGGVAKVSGLSPAAAAALTRRGGVQAVTRDVKLRFVPTPGDLSGVTRTLSSEMVAQGHNPTAAFFFPFQWNMRIVEADTAWAAGYTGNPGVRVAVLDTGIDPFHIDLAGLIDVASSRAFTPSLNPLGPAWGDDHLPGRLGA